MSLEPRLTRSQAVAVGVATFAAPVALMAVSIVFEVNPPWPVLLVAVLGSVALGIEIGQRALRRHQERD